MTTVDAVSVMASITRRQVKTKGAIVMKNEQQVKDHLVLDALLRDQPKLLDEFLHDPQGVLSRIGVGQDALDCPEAAHQAEARAEAVVEAAQSLANLTPVEAVPKLAALVRERLGDEVVATKIPFGIQFSESVDMDGDLDWTATGTIKGTFGIKIKADVDG